ncbi:hypothetical protein G6009_09100, partial [Dietzia sp. SLG510A3-30A2]|nr:hypothetical protein [Dietzia sp. SLG510A3-30A2]
MSTPRTSEGRAAEQTPRDAARATELRGVAVDGVGALLATLVVAAGF